MTAGFKTHDRATNTFSNGAPAALESAFPVGQPVTATASYDPALASAPTLSNWIAYYYDSVTGLNIQVAGHSIVASSAPLGPFDTVSVGDPGGSAQDSISVARQNLLVDGATTFAGFTVGGAVTLADFSGTVFSTTDLPANVCLAAFEELRVTIHFVDGSLTYYTLWSYGTPDRTIDSDGDGIIDGEELALRATLPALDPCDRDSDDDTLTDGSELAAGTSPVAADTDGDGLGDGVDPAPLIPAMTVDGLADTVRATANGVLEIPEAAFTGPNAHAERGRRNALANRLQAAANHIADGDLAEALAILRHVRELLDGLSSPPDVMEDGAAKDDLRDEIDALIAALEAALAA